MLTNMSNVMTNHHVEEDFTASFTDEAMRMVIPNDSLPWKC